MFGFFFLKKAEVDQKAIWEGFGIWTWSAEDYKETLDPIFFNLVFLDYKG